jgi:hypothetical protein
MGFLTEYGELRRTDVRWADLAQNQEEEDIGGLFSIFECCKRPEYLVSRIAHIGRIFSRMEMVAWV